MTPTSAWPRLLLLLVLIAPRTGFAWGNESTHPRVTEAAAVQANRDGALDDYFRNQLGIQALDAKRLPVVKGFDPEIDDDIAPTLSTSRLSCTQNLVFDLGCLFNRADTDDRIDEISSNTCDSDAANDTCERYSIGRLLRAGSFAEDNPNPRAQHHFLDPRRPLDSQGLDDRTRWLLGLDQLLAEFGTSVRGGEFLRVLGGIIEAPLAILGIESRIGNFDLKGRSALDRALDRDSASEAHPTNYFSLVDAERYLYRGLTAARKLEREHYLALHALAVGHVAHLLEDMGNPAHTRNDFVVDHGLHFLGNLEVAAEARGALRFVRDRLASSPHGELLRNRAADFMSSPEAAQFMAANGLSLPLSYAPTLPDVETSEFEVSEFWATGLGGFGGTGLAELSSQNFLSQGSIGEAGLPGAPRCPRDPDLPLDGLSDQGVVVAALPPRVALPNDPSGDDGVDLSEEGPWLFLSSSFVPHLARCGYHDSPRAGATVKQRANASASGRSVIDESVQRDYLEILLPLTVDYTAKFLRHYFQTRIELVPLGAGEFKIRNLTRLPFEANLEDVQVVFDTFGGTRRSLPVACDGGTLAIPADTGPDSNPVSTASCQLPDASADSDPNSAPKDPGEFWVVVRGRLGTRGDPPASSGITDDWKDGDYVTAFARSTNAVIYQAQPPPFGEVGLPPAEWDALEQADFYRSPVDLTGTVDPNGPSTSSENLTAHLRIAAVDDFRKPAISPDSGRIALMTDAPVDPSYQNYMTTESPELPGVLIPLNPLGLRAFAGVIDPSSDSAEATLRILGAREDDVGQLPVWLVGAEAFFARRTIAGNPADDLALYDAESGAELPHPILDNFPVTGNAANLVLADDGDPARGCGLSGDDLLAAKQDAARGQLFAANVNCLQTVDAEGGGQTYGAPLFGGQLVLLDAQGQPIEALMIDADDARAPEVRSCAGGCDFDGFTTPGLQHASFSPSTTKLAFVVGKVGAFTERGNRIFVYDYQTRQLTRIPEPQECVQGWVTWLPAGDRIAYLAYGGAPCSPTTEGAQLHVVAADGSETRGRALTSYKDGWRRGNPSWFSPLRLPGAQP